MVPEKNLATFKGWPLGVDNVNQEERLSAKAFREAVNVDLGRGGSVYRRAGYVRRVSGGNCHSLWSNGLLTFFVDGGVLYSLNTTTWAVMTVLTGLTAGARLSYEQVGQYIFFTNGYEVGRYDVVSGTASLTWGVSNPGGQPNLSISEGEGSGNDMTGGQYFVAITYLNADGQESGTGPAAYITIPDRSAIQLTSIPQGTGAKIRIYVSTVNGTSDELWQHADVPMGTDSYLITRYTPGKALRTQFMEPLPAGHLMRRYNGRMYVAVDNVLFFSDALRYHLYSPEREFIVFPERITMIEPVVDGLYVSSDRVYFLQGGDPTKYSLNPATPVKAVEGTSLVVPGHLFPALKISQNVAYWFTEHGPYVGAPGGETQALLDTRVAVNAYVMGTTQLREEAGRRQLVTSMYGSHESTGFAATDSSVIEIRRNSVLLRLQGIMRQTQEADTLVATAEASGD
jgi:hypothetical protein